MTDTDMKPGSLKELFGESTCEMHFDPVYKGLYATDASIYQITPVAVALPKSREEITELIRVAGSNKIPVLCRGGGTSLAGQTVGNALVIDFSKYYNRIIDYNPEQQWVEVEPGIVLTELNKRLKQDQLLFSPDPATSNRATIGGMIANNSSGTKSLLYGKTIDHIISMEVLLSDGTTLKLGPTTEQEFESKCAADTRESEIYKKFREIIFAHSEEIAKKFPKTLRRVSGYPFDEFANQTKWNLAKLFCGSEGTLGIVFSAKLHLDRYPQHKAVSLLHFDNRLEAIRAVKDIVKAGPVAVELLDLDILSRAKDNIVTKSYYDACVSGHPDTLLITEFFGNSASDIEEKIKSLNSILQNNQSLTASPVFHESHKMNMIWDLRKTGLGLALSSYDPEKPLPFVEDSALPLEHLAEYIEKVEDFCTKLGVKMVIYAHASVGVLHVRPYLNLKSGEDIEKMKLISEKCFSLVKQYGGSWSGEHGDGLVRSYKIKEFFGEHIYGAFQAVKQLFDPLNIMNPGKIVDAGDIDQNLRYGIQYRDHSFQGVFQYRKEKSFHQIVHNCSGIGACRKISEGTMCPSYHATLDEKHTTRGRANTLRLAASGQIFEGDLTHPEVLSVLDLCISCKGCKTECPTHVDMAKLKSEVLQMKYKKRGTSLREKFIDQSTDYARMFSGSFASIANFVNRSKMSRFLLDKVAGLSGKRHLPKYADKTFSIWYRDNYQSPKNAVTQVYLFCDTYTNYHDPHIGIAAVNLLAECGYHAELLDIGCCQRPRISNGFLEKAKAQGTQLSRKLSFVLDKKIPVLVLEPSCVSALQEDLPDLLEDEKVARQMQKHIKLIDVFLAEELKRGVLKGRFVSDSKEIALHGHCHQKALYGTSGMHQIYNSIQNLRFHEIPSGCCGMAGSFGYEKEHYEISEKIADLILVPYIKELPAEANVVANGFSCRHQIADFTGRKARHFVETVGYKS